VPARYKSGPAWRSTAPAPRSTRQSVVKAFFVRYPIRQPITSRMASLYPCSVEFEPAPVPVHLVFHPHPRPGGAIRAFVDYAAPILRDELARLSVVVSRAEKVSG
jgi:hypothetical protein